MLNIQEDIQYVQTKGLAPTLLLDHTSGSNILWVSSDYESNGVEYKHDKPVKPEHLHVLSIRAGKRKETKEGRTKNNAEVYTPVRIVRDMLDALEDELKEDFPTWEKFVNATVLEITCGEGAFIATRYEHETGELIQTENRTGIIDRKLKAVRNNTDTMTDYKEHSMKALKSVYGYEMFGDSLFIARVNALMSMREHYMYTFHTEPSDSYMREAADVIAWNIWQMDGLTGRTPVVKEQSVNEMSMFDIQEDTDRYDMECVIRDWTDDTTQTYNSLKTA